MSKQKIFTSLYYCIAFVAISFLSKPVFAASVSATYSSGDISTNYGSYSSSCNGPVTPLTVALPAGGPWSVTSVDVSYNMTAQGGAYKSEQHSKLYCQNTTTGEASYAAGVGSSSGTYSYSRNGLTIANGAFAGGTNLVFEIQAYRTWGGSGCNTTYNKVDNNTWTVTVYYSLASPMTYISSTATQNTNDVGAGTNNNQVIGIEVVTSGTTSPLSVDGFRFFTNGTTSYSTDIQNAKVYYTGTSSTFSTTVQFGTTFATPPAPSSNMDITGSQTLQEGTNYFWLTYDVPAGATINNFIDAACNYVTVNATNQSPTVSAPAGSRQIILSADIPWPGLDIGTLSCPSTTLKTGNTVGAVDDCSLGGGHVGADHIYKFTTTEEANVTISTCNATTNFDTKLFLYNSIAGDCDAQSYTAYNYDGSSGSCSGTKAEIIVEGLGAGTYVVVIKGSSATEGDYQLSIDVSNCASYVNNSWAGFDIGTLNCPYKRTFTASTFSSTDDCSYNTGADNIYKFTLTQSMDVIIDLCNSGTDYDTYLFLYDFSTGACSGAGFIDSNNDAAGCGTKSKISTSLAAGSYVIVVEGNGAAVGNYELNLSASTSCLDALGANNVTVAALPYSVTGQSTAGSGNELTSSTAVTTSCASSSYYGGEDRVYMFTPSSSGDITITLSNANSYASIMLYEGCPLKNAYTCGGTQGSCVGYDADSGSGPETITASVSAGTTYYLVLDIYPSPSNYTYDLSITAPTSCLTGTSITLPYSLASGTTCGKGDDINNSNDLASGTCGTYGYYLNDEDDIYEFIPTTSGNIDISVTQAGYGAINLYKGCPLNGYGGECAGAANSSSSGVRSFTACVEAGQKYFLVLDSYDVGANCMAYSNLSISAPYCSLGSGNVNIASLPYAASSQTTTGSGNDIVGSSAHVECWYSSAATSVGLDKVYIFTPSTTGEISINASNLSTNDATMTLYEGCPTSNCQPGTCTGYLHQSSDPLKVLNANVTAGETYYLVMDRFSSGTGYTFDIDITSPATLADDENYCTTAPLLASSPTNLNIAALASATGDYPSDFDDVSCIDNASGNVDNNIWYKFIPTQTSVSFEFNNISSNAIQAEIFSSVNGKCGTLSSVASYCNTSCTIADFSLTATVIPGHVYYLMIDGCAGVSPTFDLSSSGISSGAFGGNPVILSLEVDNLSAQCNGSKNVVSWYSSSLVNVEYFTVEKSNDGIHFTPIDDVKSKVINEDTKYEFIDDQISNNEESYYVIRYTDFDGNYDYSKIVSVKPCKSSRIIKEVNITPNPFNTSFNVSFIEPLEDDATINIYDFTGRLVYAFRVNQGEAYLNLPIGMNLTDGTYFLELQSSSHKTIKKIIKISN